MPRCYKRRTEKGSWSADRLEAAIAAIKTGRSIREVSKTFEIPRSTIQKRMKNSNNEEQELAAHVIKLSKLFYGVSRDEIKKCAYEYAVKNNIKSPFNKEKKVAGNDWLSGFLKRNPTLSLRKPEPTSVNRITAFNKEQVSLFFENLDKILTKYKCKASRIFNTDETGISTVQKPGRILAEKGLKQVGYATSWERGKNITVVCAFSATGIYVPPMFIYGRKRMNVQIQKGGPPGASYFCSDKGWMTEELFIQYLKHFKKFVKPTTEDPVLLIMDNHVTHCTLDAYTFCKENGIILLTIPPHTSHRLQPLDVTFYSPLKTAFNAECNKYLKNHPHEKITPFEVAELFNNAYMRVATLEKATKGFQVTGICPFNPDVFSDEDFAPAELHMPNLDVVQMGEETLELQQPDSQENLNPDKDISILDTDHASDTRNMNDSSKETTGASLKRENLPRVCTTVRGHKDSTSEEEWNDDEDMDKNVSGQDICLVCGEFGKNNELWLRCVSCGNWAHKACSDVEQTKFICDYCL
ncbi:hypothetical protein PPYR_01061 [Photinus pyralis]|uniref:HTH psq-type domain-containing protein n=1 Tax=Photinus pyralis TaxID=7054 RepID=A0A5N4B397_PHOPY|nr:hypothetical protein PPYR_01061 [Photinus pyralis]